MKNELNNLSNEELIQAVLEKDIQVQEHKIEVQNHKTELQRKDELIAKLQRMLFGTKSERFKTEPVDPNQLTLSFEQLLAKLVEAQTEQTVKETVTFEREKKSHPGRYKLPDNLPEHVIVIEPQDSTQGLVKIGEERTEILEMALTLLILLKFSYSIF